ncbi:hypothetical protein BpHYR1_044788 [Brachionus plicatilis]|uniref:Uncharacterized protein n=1 Tax=Brachionus plicatilis TaxID=10195 RepID=A0A3M7PQL9_BRAPC|nr:hypothetical protein BpHYR1_044788 [Brachionus plicatilis]
MTIVDYGISIVVFSSDCIYAATSIGSVSQNKKRALRKRFFQFRANFYGIVQMLVWKLKSYALKPVVQHPFN